MLTMRFAPAAKPLIAGAPSDCAAQPTRTRICRDSVGMPALEYHSVATRDAAGTHPFGIPLFVLVPTNQPHDNNVTVPLPVSPGAAAAKATQSVPVSSTGAGLVVNSVPVE